MGYEYTNIRHRIILRSLLLGVFTVPFLSFANVSFTEIMYDVSGSDTGREWVEITADTATDLSDWKLFEANTNHTLTLVKGAALVPAGSFVVIADNTEKFLLDFPSFTGTLFDSSFSLSNTGETISLRNADLVDTDTVSYTSGQGAAGDGNSLQKINSVWAASLPTPGAANNTSANTNDTPPAGADSGAISTQENSKILLGLRNRKYLRMPAQTALSLWERILFSAEKHTAPKANPFLMRVTFGILAMGERKRGKACYIIIVIRGICRRAGCVVRVLFRA